jgi:transcriptional regulator with XRE-family HTH domain
MPRRQRRTYPDLVTYFNESGDTQAAFAARINKSQSYISKVRNGWVEPSLADALIIAKEAGVPLESLIKRQPAVSDT